DDDRGGDHVRPEERLVAGVLEPAARPLDRHVPRAPVRRCDLLGGYRHGIKLITFRRVITSGRARIRRRGRRGGRGPWPPSFCSWEKAGRGRLSPTLFPFDRRGRL